MRWNKLTLLLSLLVPVIIVFDSCKPEDQVSPPTTYSKTDIVMSGAQETPVNPSPGTGRLNVSYSKVSKLLSYSFTWSGLTGPPNAAHIHGLAPAGYPASVVQTFSSLAASTSGSYSGSFLVDGIKVKEEDLLSGLYYVNIHTNTYPGGEIRGQIRFY